MENRFKINENQKNGKNKSNSKIKCSQKPKAKSTSALPQNSQMKKEHYKVFSKSNILMEVKNMASNSLTNVKRNFASFSTLLKPIGHSKSNKSSYSQISNLPTPVKLYSPFSIETPNGFSTKANANEQLFITPRTREDIENLKCGLAELNHLTDQIEHPRARRSIFPKSQDLLIDPN